MTNGQTVRLKKAFLRHFAATGNVTASCTAAGIKRRANVYEWQEIDPDFKAAFADAEEAGADELEAEARRRGLAFSDTLLIFLLKGARPDKYRDRASIEHSGPGGGAIAQDVTFTDAALRAAEAAALASLGLAGGEPAALGDGARDNHPSDQGAPAV